MAGAYSLVVIGSGPVGSTFARRTLDLNPDATVLVVDAGPQLTRTPGENIRNLPADQRIPLQERVSGPLDAGGSVMGGRPIVARPGTTLVAPDDGRSNGQSGMPAAAVSTNVGGMGAHWTCASPRPGGSERIGFIPADELDRALTVAEDLLDVTTTAFRPTPVGDAVLDALRRRYAVLPDARPPGPMPLACRPQGGGLPHWSGADAVLGDTDPRLELRPDTLARRLLVDGERVTGVELVDRVTGETDVVTADVVAVAADAFRTPQLLWASGIRPAALGRYLNDQPQIIAGARVNIDAAAATTTGDARDSLTGVCWVPFTEDLHPFHGQVMQMDSSPITVEAGGAADPRPFVALGWFATKDITPDDRVWFDGTDRDSNGLPAIRIDYHLTDRDRRTIDRAAAELVKVAEEIGELAREPRLLPAGYSLHYQGTTRMGPVDDGTSVCDRDSRVWGIRNLFVGGNGVIPTATACNPTLTSVALAVLAAERVAQLLSDAPKGNRT